MGLLSKRDQRSVIRRTPAKTKAIAFIIFAVITLLSVVLLFVFLQSMRATPAGDIAALMAGKNFQPGTVADLYGSSTQAVLEGLNQKVQATNPTDLWKDSLTNVVCSGDGVCLADAPRELANSTNTNSSGGEGLSVGQENFSVFSLLSGLFAGGLPALGGPLLLLILLWAWLNEDNK